MDTSELNKEMPLIDEAKISFSPYVVPFLVIFLVLAADGWEFIQAHALQTKFDTGLYHWPIRRATISD